MFRVGVIGVGNMGSLHLKNIVEGKVGNGKVTAVCDCDKERLAKYKEELGEGVSFYENATDLIHSGLVDGVVIATPHYDHPTIAIEAFKAGLHVFCEKPAGVYTKNVREMNAAAEEAGTVFQVNFVLRTSDANKKIKELMDRKEIGELKRVTWIITDWYRTQAYYNSGGWRATWAGEGGGTLLNQNPHQLDLMQWFCGMPKRVRANCYFGKNRDIEVEDEATAYFEYENGAVGVYMTSVSEFPGTNRLEIVGDRGKLVFEEGKIKVYQTTVSEKEFNKTTQKGMGPIPMNCYELTVEKRKGADMQAEMIQNWIGAATGKETLIANGTEGINSLLVTNAIYLSSWNDGWVELPFDEDEYYQKLQEKIQTSRFVKQEVAKVNVDINDTFHK